MGIFGGNFAGRHSWSLKLRKPQFSERLNRKPHPLTEEAEEGRKDGSPGGGSAHETISKGTRLGMVSMRSEEAAPSALPSLPPRSSPGCPGLCWPGSPLGTFAHRLPSPLPAPRLSSSVLDNFQSQSPPLSQGSHCCLGSTLATPKVVSP